MVFAAAILFVLSFFHQLSFLNYEIPPLPVHHWFSWLGAIYIAGVTPAFYYLKHRYRKSYQTFMQIHMFGNLAAFMLISVHFGHHLSEFFTIIPHPGTGLPLYIAIILMVATGILMRFQIATKRMRQMRFLHISMTLAFYLIIAFHILRGVQFF